ncbi:MarR family winged helix-turn-helix transcriptional regulator [Rhodococcoides yunnanense]|uniref:MarR family winged helix-turn-helix transcriptional regulator n=1 Tax=Rhodococcoides yunnanense TaxID=278209 RepID=UPI000932606F|nr:MarR family transcriptional regulator [Rhodococcus yunnanensis]
MNHRPVLEDDLGFLLTRAGATMVREANTALAAVDLKVRPYTVLSLACEDGGGVAQRRIAADMGLDPSQIVGLIDDLESRDLVVRTPDSGDRRNKLIVATADGRALCEQARELVAAVSTRLFADVDAELLDQMRTVLSGLAFPEAAPIGTRTVRQA